jgi:hypothetical protein
MPMPESLSDLSGLSLAESRAGRGEEAPARREMEPEPLRLQRMRIARDGTWFTKGAYRPARQWFDYSRPS